MEENEKNDELTNDIEKTLDELGELTKDDNADINVIKQKIQELKDGTQLLSGEFEEEEVDLEPELSMQEKKAIYRFVNRVKQVSDETIEALTDEEMDRLSKISLVLLNHFNYRPKKKFGKAYKKKRQHRNRLAKKSRQANARR